MKGSFLRPGVLNLLITLIVFSLPMLRQGGVGGSDYYQPIRLLTNYWKTGEWQSFWLMAGLVAVIYVAASYVVALAGNLWEEMK